MLTTVSVAPAIDFPCAGFQGTTLIDYPGHIAAIVFVPGCNLRCPYCHNGTLFSVPDEELMPSEALWGELLKRREFIDGVVITGGEPSLYPGLVGFAHAVREQLRLEVKLDTNGLDPAFIRSMLPHLSYVAIDLKAMPERYYLLGAAAGPGAIRERLRATKALLTEAPVRVEYRTTMYPPIVDGIDTLSAMMEFVPPNAEIYLQQFVTEHAWSEEAQRTAPFETAHLKEMLDELRRSSGRNHIYLRGYS